jgi:hypothetical protein
MGALHPIAQPLQPPDTTRTGPTPSRVVLGLALALAAVLVPGQSGLLLERWLEWGDLTHRPVCSSPGGPRMSLRCLALITAICASLLVAAAPAMAQAPTQRFGQVVNVTGAGKNNKQFTGTFTIARFQQVGDRAYAVGTLRGKLKNRPVRRSRVKIPISIEPFATTAKAKAAQVTPPIVPTPNACQVLNLVLGPLDLNLLGLRVRLNQVRLLIEAVPSNVPTGGVSGGLLGDLLCGVANLLNPQAGTPLGQLTQLLNGLLGMTTPPTASAAALPRTAGG